MLRELKQKLSEELYTPDLRKFVGDSRLAHRIAQEQAQIVIDALGINELSASEIFPLQYAKDFAALDHFRESLHAKLGRVIARESLTRFVEDRPRSYDPLSGNLRITRSALVITHWPQERGDD